MDQKIRLRMWRSGAHAVSTLGEDGTARLVEQDGHGAVHTIDASPDGFEETVARRRTETHGVTVRTSRLRGTAAGDLEWERRTTGEAGTRNETWALPAGKPGAWTREDVRRNRVTRFSRGTDGTIAAAATDRASDAPLWRAAWRRDGGRLNGVFIDPEGKEIGSAEVGRDGVINTATWSAPFGEGTIAAAPGGTTVRPDVVIHKTLPTGAKVDIRRTDDGEGHWHEVGSRTEGRDSAGGIIPGATWIKIGVPYDSRNPMRPEEGGRGTAEFGTDYNPDGTETLYTINKSWHLDGSKTVDRWDQTSNGDRAESHRHTDRHGNTSETMRVSHSDGSWSVTTTTTDKHGNGTKHTTTGDKDGHVKSDTTTPVSGPPPSSGNDDEDDSSGGDEDEPDAPEPDDGGGDDGLPAGDGTGGVEEGNPDGVIAGMDFETLRRMLGRAWRGEQSGDSLGDAEGRLGPWLERLHATVAQGGSVTADGEKLDDLGAPITGLDFSGIGGLIPDEELDDLGRPIIDIEIEPPPGSGDGPVSLQALVEISTALAAGSAAVAGSSSVLAEALGRADG